MPMGQRRGSIPRSHYQPGEHIGMDSIVNLPPDIHGYQHVLVIVDHFTRWTELTPIKTLEAEEACQVILDYITRYGTPQNITSDNGTQFINSSVGNLIALLNIEPIPILPYNHQENGIVENRNRIIRRLLTACQKGSEKDYLQACALARRVLNSPQQV